MLWAGCLRLCGAHAWLLSTPVQRGKSVEEYRESYTSTARAYIMPVIMEALVLIVVCVVTYALVMRAAERS